MPKTGEHIPLELQHTDFQDFGLEPMYAAPKAIDEQAKREVYDAIIPVGTRRRLAAGNHPHAKGTYTSRSVAARDAEHTAPGLQPSTVSILRPIQGTGNDYPLKNRNGVEPTRHRLQGEFESHHLTGNTVPVANRRLILGFSRQG